MNIYLSPKRIKELHPVNDGFTYYQSFGETITKAAANHAVREVINWLDELQQDNTSFSFIQSLGDWECVERLRTKLTEEIDNE